MGDVRNTTAIGRDTAAESRARSEKLTHDTQINPCEEETERDDNLGFGCSEDVSEVVEVGLLTFSHTKISSPRIPWGS